MISVRAPELSTFTLYMARDRPESDFDLRAACREPGTARLLDAIGQAVIVADPDGLIRFWNLGAARLYGWTREQVLGRHVIEVTTPTISRRQAGDVMSRLTRGEPWTGSRLVRRRDGSTFEAFVTDMPIQDADGQLVGIIGLSEDITSRNDSMEALISSEERFRQAAETVPDIVFTFDDRGRPDYINERFREFTGMSISDAVAGRWIDCIHLDDRRRIRRAWTDARRASATAEIHHRLQMSDGSYRWFITRARPFQGRQGRRIQWFGTSTDVDDLRRAEEKIKALNASLESRVAMRTAQVRALSSALALAEQRERNRITRFLHDDIQQLLYAIKLRTDVIGADIDNPALRDSFVGITASVDEAIEAIRSLTVELNPPLLHGEGLDVALEWLAVHMHRTYGLNVRVEVEPGCMEVNERRRTLLYQTVRELLFNVVKHADVDHAAVRLSCSNGQLVLVVEDEGVGFEAPDSSAETTNESLGLFSARERLRLIGGSMSIESGPNRGTRVTVRSPIEV